MTFNVRVPLVTVLAGVLCARVVFAQSMQTGGYSGGLFGSGSTGNSRQAFDVAVSLAELYDSDTPAGFNVVDPTSLGGYSTMLVGTAEYRYRGSRVQFASTGASVFRYYNELDEVKSLSHSIGVGLSARLGGRTSFALDQTVAYSPSYLFGLYPRYGGQLGDAIPPAPDYDVNQVESYTYGTTASVTRNLDPRSKLSFSGDFGYTDFLHEDLTRRDLKTMGGRAEFSRNVTRNVAFETGYRYGSGQFGYGSSTTTTEHGVDVGFTLDRPLSATRRALFGLRVGASTAVLPGSAAVPATGSDRYQMLVAETAAGWQFSRSWLAQGTYHRGFEFVAGLTEPAAVDGVSASVTGLLSPRVDLSVLGGYSSGQSLITRSGMNFKTYTGSVRLRYALSLTAAVYGEYLYFSYDFAGRQQLAWGLAASTLQRNGVRVGFTWRLSALGR